MIMDVDHMDIPTFDAAMTIAEARHYPGISSGHTGIVPTGNDTAARHEGNKTLADLERIRDDGGLVSIILHQGDRNDIKTTIARRHCSRAVRLRQLRRVVGAGLSVRDRPHERRRRRDR